MRALNLNLKSSRKSSRDLQEALPLHLILRRASLRGVLCHLNFYLISKLCLNKFYDLFVLQLFYFNRLFEHVESEYAVFKAENIELRGIYNVDSTCKTLR